MNPWLAVASALALAAPVQGQQAPAAPSADRTALEARLLALMPLPIEAKAHTEDAALLKRDPGKEAIFRPILTDFRTCSTNAFSTAIAQAFRKSLSDLSDDDLHREVDFFTGPDGSRFREMLIKFDTLDKADRNGLEALRNKYPEQMRILSMVFMSMVFMSMVDTSTGRLMRPEHDCFIATEKALVQAGIDTGETPRYQREAAFVTAAGPGITARFTTEERGEAVLRTALKSSDLADANPGRKDAIHAILEHETRCRVQAYAALAARLLPQLAADLPDTTLDRMTAFYTGPDSAHYAELDRPLYPTKAQRAALTVLRKKYAMDEFDKYYEETFSAATRLNPDPAWTAANQACDAATDQALAAAKLIRPPEPAESRQ